MSRRYATIIDSDDGQEIISNIGQFERVARRWNQRGACQLFEKAPVAPSPPETFAAFKAAFAKGGYFNEHIRNNFRYRLVEAGNDPG